jgi:O-antigen ligase
MRVAALEVGLTRQRRWLIWGAGFLYTLALHKFVIRDPLSSGAGVQGILELGFTISAFLCTFLALWSAKKRFPPSGALICFGFTGVLVLASTWRSFNPPLSLAKGFLFFAVFGMAYMAGQAGYLTRLFQSIYWTYVASIVVGVLVGLAMPGRYPLWSSDEWTGRNRFSVFVTFPGTMGETGAYLILLAPLIFYRSHWASRGLLLLANLLAGGKTSTATLFGLLCIEYLLKLRTARSWRSAALVGALLCGVGAVSYLTLIENQNPAELVGNRLSNVYGHDVVAEAVTLDGRLDLWKGTVSLMVGNPLLGFGVDGARDALLKLAYWSGTAHNGFLDIGLNGGIVALLLFVAGLLLVLRACMEAGPNVRSQLLLVFGYMFVISWTGITFTFPSYFGILILVFLLFLARESKEVTKAADGVGFLSHSAVPVATSA